MRLPIVKFAVVGCMAASFPSLTYAVGQEVISAVFSSHADPYTMVWKGFNEHLKSVGITPEMRVHDMEDNNDLLENINRENPKLIFALGSKSLKWVQENTRTTPIVFSMVINPELLSSSGITGVSLDIPVSMKLTTVRRVLGSRVKVGVLYSTESVEEVKKITDCDASITVVAKNVHSQQEFPDALADLLREADCVWMIPDAKIYSPKTVSQLLMESLKKRRSVIGLSSHYTKAGALLSFDCDYEDVGRQSADLARNVFQGTASEGKRVHLPRKVSFSINVTTARLLGIEIPPDIIKEAQEVMGR